MSIFYIEWSKIPVLFGNCDLTVPIYFLLWLTFPIFRFVLLSSHTPNQLLSGVLCFKLIYLYGYLSRIFVLSTLFIYLIIIVYAF